MPQLKPTRGICLNRSHPISRGLVGLWLFNEGSGNKVSDLSGNQARFFGNFAGNTAWKPGKSGPSCYFDGTDDMIKLQLWDGGPKVTLFARVRFEETIGVYYEQICAADNYSDALRTFQFRRNIEGKLQFIVFVNNTAYTITGNTILTTGEWWDVAVVNNGTNCHIYVNGVEDATPVATGNMDTDAAAWAIGARPDYVNWTVISEPLQGRIEFLMRWDMDLSAPGIALLYQEPFCMFEEAMRPKSIGGQIVHLAGSSVALSSLSATAKAMRKVGGNVVSTTDVTAILNLFCSLLYIESNWKREALFNGMTANAFKLGTTLSLGWFWVRVAGCSVLYRGSTMGEIDFVNILAVAEQDACEISPPSYISHNSGSTYFYVVRRFNDCGYQECTLAASVKVSIESTGELAKPQPNKVFDLGAELVDGNKIKLVWYYCPLEQKSQPMYFNVYYDGRTGQINYENPLAIIGYKGRKFYSYQCGALEAGRYLFAIRTEDASGIENSSLARLRIQFDPTNPEAIDILSAEGV